MIFALRNFFSRPGATSLSVIFDGASRTYLATLILQLVLTKQLGLLCSVCIIVSSIHHSSTKSDNPVKIHLFFALQFANIFSVVIVSKFCDSLVKSFLFPWIPKQFFFIPVIHLKMKKCHITSYKINCLSLKIVFYFLTTKTYLVCINLLLIKNVTYNCLKHWNSETSNTIIIIQFYYLHIM